MDKRCGRTPVKSGARRRTPIDRCRVAGAVTRPGRVEPLTLYMSADALRFPRPQMACEQPPSREGRQLEQRPLSNHCPATQTPYPTDQANARDLQAFLQAAEGIRTLDLLHGKQTPIRGMGAGFRSGSGFA